VTSFESALSDRQAVGAFALGCLAVAAGVVAHLPMFAMARSMGYQLAGMPVDYTMLGGMALIILGTMVAAYGLLPRNLAAQRAASADIVVAAPEDAPLGRAHWGLMIVLVIALVIDVMKPASLGFTVPGMVSEYGVPKQTVSLVPFFALAGTVTGSVLWGWIADVYGRKATILLSAVMFVGTSICGAMPSLAWNIAMCFLMGAAAGGMLPVTYALLAEMMPSRHRGWALVLVGGLGAVGGYFAASGLSALLQPIFGWRILWLANLPTGLTLILLGALIPESAKFLLARERVREAHAIMQRFGAQATRISLQASPRPEPPTKLVGMQFYGKLVALSTCALSWGLINFGLLLWLPADLVAKGYSVGVSSRLLAESALIAFPTVFVAALLYSRWSTKWALATMIALTLAGLLLVLRLEQAGGGSPVLPVALLIIGTNGIIAIVLPYTAESFPLRVRARATGWIAACTKAGGLLAQGLTISGVTLTMGTSSLLVMIPTAMSLAFILWFGRETRGRDLRDLDAVANL
jgi:MFS transporter, putative metabolite:H+ symporter